MGEHAVQTWLIEIAPDECDELLASTPLGRLSVVVDGRPEIFPVNHVYDRRTRTVAFPTNDRTKLRAALGWPYVGFEVDGYEDGRGGWSVLVVGHAEEIEDAEEVARLASSRRVLWRESTSARWIRIVPAKITGRKIKAMAS